MDKEKVWPVTGSPVKTAALMNHIAVPEQPSGRDVYGMAALRNGRMQAGRMARKKEGTATDFAVWI